jgi:hypothetical protein
MTRRSKRAIGITLAIALVGCNAILGNEPGTLTEPQSQTGATLPTPDAGGAESSADAGSTPPPAPPPPSLTCTDSQQICNAQCVSKTDPLYGCGDGSCAPCQLTHATATCTSECAVRACDPGWAECNGKASDGCETDLSKAATCGACNTPCPAAAPNCAPSGATFACTNGCSPAAPLLCGADCVDPQTSTSHCGGCAVNCPDIANGTTTCQVGVCGFTCKVGFHACVGKCAQDTDPLACGAACTVCPVPAHAQATCVAGVCGKTCAAGYGDCDLNPATGCEAVFATDALNCGLCGHPCIAPLTCKAGVCAL